METAGGFVGADTKYGEYGLRNFLDKPPIHQLKAILSGDRVKHWKAAAWNQGWSRIG